MSLFLVVGYSYVNFQSMLEKGLQGSKTNQATGMMNGPVNVRLTPIRALVPLNRGIGEGH